VSDLVAPISRTWTRWVPSVLLGFFTALWLARWPTFPLLLDPWYHLLIARQLIEAGGPITFEWWQYAPVGRVHLYPPALHLSLAGLLGLGCSPIAAIRLLSVVIPCALVVSIYATMRTLFGPAVGLGSLLMALASFTWTLQVSGAMASGLASLCLLALLASLWARRWRAASCWLGLLCYTHLGLPWVAVAGIAWALLLRALGPIRPVVITAGAGLALGLPWLTHVMRHAHLLQVTGRYENATLEFASGLWVAALYGAWRCWRGGPAARLLVSLWLGFSLMAHPYTFRWLSGEGILAVILLAGYGVADAAARLARSRRPAAAPWIVMLALSGVVWLAPTILVTGQRVQVAWWDSTPFHLFGSPMTQRKSLDVQLYTPHTLQLAQTVAALSEPDEIVWSNMAYAGGLIASLSRRAMSSAMLYEVPPAQPLDQVGAAQWIVWFKVAPLPGAPDLATLRKRYPLTVAAEDEIAVILRHSTVVRRAHRPEAAVPWGLAFMLLCVLIGGVLQDYRWLKPKTS